LLASRPLAERAHGELRRMVLAGELAPGATVAEEELAVRLGISRTPVREALRRLGEEGLVEAGARRRARVATLDAAEIDGVLAVRAALDGLAAASCAKRHGSIDLPGLRRLAERVERLLAAGDRAAAFATDGEFHLALGRESGNRELCSHLARISGRVQLVRLLRCQEPRAIRSRTAMHGALLDAIAAGDAERAARLARDHAQVPS